MSRFRHSFHIPDPSRHDVRIFCSDHCMWSYPQSFCIRISCYCIWIISSINISVTANGSPHPCIPYLQEHLKYRYNIWWRIYEDSGPPVMLEISYKDLAPCLNCGCLLWNTYYCFLSHQSKCLGLKISKKMKVLVPQPIEDNCPACSSIFKYPHQPHNCPGW